MLMSRPLVRGLFSLTHNDTIFALATGIARASPVAIVRLSGPEAYKCLTMMGSPSSQSKHGNSTKAEMMRLHKIRPRYAHNKIIHGVESGQVIDKSIVIYFPEGNSYNGEDIFQLHLHGSKAVLKIVFKQLLHLGFRIAEPGEFTKRALLNDKMNVLEVEGLHQLIQSENQFCRRLAIGQLLGETSRRLEEIKQQLVSCLASCQAFIDFQEDEMDVRADLFDKTKLRVAQVINRVRQSLSRRKQVQTLSSGVNVVIVGKPNAGKSTIVNKLCRDEVSIVSDEPGTTRDVVNTTFQYKGVSFNVADTAGIRDTQVKVEKEGIRRAIQKTKYSHINLLIVDASEQKVQQTPDCTRVYMEGTFDEGILQSNKTIVVLNKTDLVRLDNSKPTFLCAGDQRLVDLKVSALYENVDQILDYLLEKTSELYDLEEHAGQILLSRERHFMCLERCLAHLNQYMQTGQVDIASEELRLATMEIGNILGRVDCQDVLDVLFRDFCIGK